LCRWGLNFWFWLYEMFVTRVCLIEREAAYADRWETC